MPPNQKPTLDIHPTPFKPSHLSIPPSPLSPQTPLQTLPPRHRSLTLPTPDTRYVPPPPLQWLWQCHQCRRTYSLGVTRRCLEDGHSFCAGTTTVKSWRRSVRPVRAKRHRACASEFDYQGWKAWGRWKRSGKEEEGEGEEGSDVSLSSGEESESSDGLYDDDDDDDEEEVDTCISPPLTKDCWTMCDYPSECRWGSRLGVHSPVDNHNLQIPTLPPISSPVSPQVHVQPQSLPQSQTPTPPTTFEDILKPEEACKKGGRGEKVDFWNALVASATRRKYVAPSSPLAGGSSGGGNAKEGDGGERDTDGDVVMVDGASASTFTSMAMSTATASPPSVNMAPMTRSSSVTSLRDIIRKGTKRGKSSSKVPVVGENRSTRVANGELYAGAESRERITTHVSQAMRTGTQIEDGDEGKGDVRTPRLWEIGKAL